MKITIKLTKEELEQTSMTEGELAVDVIDRIESFKPELPGYDVFVVVE